MIVAVEICDAYTNGAYYIRDVTIVHKVICALVPPGSQCGSGEECGGGSTCIGAICVCPPGRSAIVNGECQPPALGMKVTIL